MLVLNHKTLTIADVPEEFKHSEGSFLDKVLIDHLSLEEVSKKYVKMVLDHVQGNKKAACELLKINYRTLQKKLGE
jgi:DNA-binding protein Fis